MSDTPSDRCGVLLLNKQSIFVCSFLMLAAAGYHIKSSIAQASMVQAGVGVCLAVGSDSVDASVANVNVETGPNFHRQVQIGGAEFIMGTSNGYPEELAAHKASVESFAIDIHEVTNRQFAAFVEETGYVTTAERTPDPENYPDIPAELLVPGSASFIALDDRPKGQWRDWWKFIEGANWQQPKGPGSNIEGLDNHPVVHVSYLDAVAYATWAGRALPTEAQWEFAAQASAQLKQANTWQGFFPLQDKALDGFDGIAPVGCYKPDSNGLFDMKGNVWELVTDAFQPNVNDSTLAHMRVIKGGSFLCADNFCKRDRPQARQGQEEDFSTDHVGFRTVALPDTRAANNTH